MVQGSYPRYVDEEKERLLREDEENQLIEVNEIALPDEDDKQPEEPPTRCRWARWKKCCRKNNKDRKKRPLWRRFLRLFFTMGLFYFLFTSFAPFFAGIFSCNHGMMRHRGPIPVVKVGETPFEKPKMHYEFDDDLASFFVKQETSSRIPTRTNVFGSVQFVAGAKDKTSVDFHVKVSDESLWDSINISPKKDGIAFSADAFSIVEQFINVTAVVSLSKKTEKLFISTRELNVSVTDVDNHFNVSRISTVAGDVNIHGTHKSKCTKISSVSGDVKGTFDLVYGVAVKTISGDIKIEVNPIDTEKKQAYLGTSSISGDNKVHVIHPLHSRPLKSWHRTTSGDISIRYPEEWQGRMKLATTSGDFHLKGSHLDVKKKKKGLAGKLWKAIKGKGKSSAKLQTVSGDVYVSVGDE